MEKLNKCAEKFPIGSVVYYIYKHGWQWSVKFGLVDSYYHDSIGIKCIRMKDFRTINGVPYKDFVPNEKRQKLPKGWTYSTRLYKIDVIHDVPENIRYDTSDPKCIIDCYNKGFLIDEADYDHSHIETDITKDGWKLVKKYYPYKPLPPSRISRPYFEVFTTEQEADEYVNNHNKEIERTAQLTDYEWSLEQIDNTLNRAIKLNYITEDESKSIREQLLKEDIENVETRIAYNGVQWKLCKNKKWLTISI